MAKKVPLAEEKEYIALSLKAKAMVEEINEMKDKFIVYHGEGRSFQLIKVVESSRATVPWRKLYEAALLELLGEPLKVLRRINKELRKFAPEPIAPSFQIKDK